MKLKLKLITIFLLVFKIKNICDSNCIKCENNFCKQCKDRTTLSNSGYCESCPNNCKKCFYSDYSTRCY